MPPDELSAEPLKALFAAMGQQDQQPSIEAALAERDTTAREAVLATLDGFDAETYLLARPARHRRQPRPARAAVPVPLAQPGAAAIAGRAAVRAAGAFSAGG